MKKPHALDLASIPPRDKKDGHWFYVSHIATNRIREKCDDASATLAVYMALCEFSNEARAETFEVSQNRIAALCCYSRKVVNERVQDLERIRLVEVHRNSISESINLKAPSTYTILKCDKR